VEFKLVRRIEELDGVLQEAASGTYGLRVEYESRIPELMNLSSSANSLIDQVQHRESELKLRLKERETLLDEIHHRVKNNLNVVISLLNLQNEQLHDVEQVRGALEKTRNRIYSIALTHEKLYHSENLTEVNMRAYVESFLSTFNSSMLGDTRISIASELDEVNLSITYAVPCGIILNELLTNAVQHAFDGREGGTIKVSFTSPSERQYRLVVEDDGEGLADDFEYGMGSSLGLLLVETLINQIRGELVVSSEDGSRFEVVFDVPETKESCRDESSQDDANASPSAR
jgi:two-component sensor histidine kinase